MLLFLTQNLSLRPAEKEDKEFARQTHHRAYYDVVKKQFGDWDIQEQDKYFESTWSIYPSEVIIWKDQPCGYWSVVYSPGEIHLHQFLILPEYQGNGIGTTLLRYLLDQSIKTDTLIKLRVFRESRAKNLYKAVGFQEIKESKDHIIMQFNPRP